MTNTPHEPRLARVAAMVADPARSRMLAYLLSGECASASELAKAASVTPATASGHLAQLLEAHFVVYEPRGRHRYYRLADADVAHALEALAVVAERGEHDSEWSSPERARLRYARCCYGHLAGRLGIQLFQGLMAVDGLQPVSAGYALTDSGRAWCQRLGFEPPAPGKKRRFAYPCLDWSERRDHLAGELADRLYLQLVAQGWVRRGAGRDVVVTPVGQQKLLPLLAP
ncbi:ArsR/SmtB family transcription factor [Hydrogenophaga taeniospiralis]|uniref:ArsR/SmtB family transcription factor n=1 Tax=Hydrogenophaga taeniospiralis TaxID=65656 RepID=UPI001CFB9C91|nr:winged helix-turn-helix domain-containing protein [Hydrogenophaga taeniospiralis]UCU94332.1 winged helix-turn-helix transcriptional regulator [Hydrogenophaga taeniospiralis]